LLRLRFAKLQLYDGEKEKNENREARELRIFGTRTKECNCHPSSHIGTPRGDAIIAHLTLSSEEIFKLNLEVLSGRREKTVYEEF
jgi:hypothetical protein